MPSDQRRYIVKKRLIAIIMLVGIFAATAVVSNAQIIRQLKTSVPFSFNIGKAEYPTGDYVISFGVTPAVSTIIIRSESGSSVGMAIVRAESVIKPNDANGVTFERVSGRYHLSGVSFYALKLDLGGPKSDLPGLKIAAK